VRKGSRLLPFGRSGCIARRNNPRNKICAQTVYAQNGEWAAVVALHFGNWCGFTFTPTFGIIMPEFAINEGTFQIPDGWEDKSITALAFPQGAAVPSASVTVTRELLTDSAVSLHSYVDAQLAKLAKTCASFHLTQRRDWQLNHTPAEVLEFTWKTPDGIHVRQLMVVTFWGPQSLVFTSTATTDKFAEFQALFEGVIASFRARS
jgi:hypothetical protein